MFNKDGVVFRSSFFIDREYGILVGDDGAIWKTTDAGNTWKDLSQPSFGDLIHVDVTLAKDVVFICSRDAVWRSIDEGETWDKVFEKSGVKINRVTKSWFFDATMCHISCDDGKIYNSLSDGDKWYLQETSKLIGSDENVLFCNGGNTITFLPDSAFAYTTSKKDFVQTINDFNSTFSVDNVLENTELQKVSFPLDFSGAYVNVANVFKGENNEIAFVPIGGSGKTLNESSNNNVNDAVFLQHMRNADDKWYHFQVGNGGYTAHALVGTYNFKVTQENAVTTKDLYFIDLGGPQVAEQGNSFEYMSLFAAGDGVVLRKTLNWTPTKIDKLPQEASVSAYPNPFDNQINISTNGFTQGEQVTVNIYNIQGQLVSQLYNGQVQESELQLQTNVNGQSGIYFVEVTSNTKRAVVRLVKS